MRTPPSGTRNLRSRSGCVLRMWIRLTATMANMKATPNEIRSAITEIGSRAALTAAIAASSRLPRARLLRVGCTHENNLGR